MEEKNKLLKFASSSFQFRMYLFYQLPAAFFSGIRVKEINNEKCITSVPFKWLTQNPFRSTYFASLAMAAEMSSGVLALVNTYKKNPSISMLVTKMEAEYFKKAKETTFFICDDGILISEAVNKTAISKDAEIIRVKSTGKNLKGELIAEFFFTWSFKAR